MKITSRPSMFVSQRARAGATSFSGLVVEGRNEGIDWSVAALMSRTSPCLAFASQDYGMAIDSFPVRFEGLRLILQSDVASEKGSGATEIHVRGISAVMDALCRMT